MTSIEHGAPPSGRQDHERRRDLLAAFSLGNLCLLDVWRRLFLPSTEEYFFFRPPVAGDYVSVFVALGIFALIFYFLLAGGRNGPLRPLLRVLVVISLLLPLNLVRLESQFTLVRMQALAREWWFLPLVATGLGAIWTRRTRWFTDIRTALLIVSPFLLVTTTRSLAATVNALRHPPAIVEDRFGVESFSDAPSDARALVLLFDELDERFIDPSTRPRGLALPELDRLRNESIVFEETRPAGGSTLIAIPALTTGREILDARALDADDLELVTEDGTTTWKHLHDIFGIAASERFNVAIVGWYVPYCRMFRTAAFCTWEPHFQSLRPDHHNPVALVTDKLLSVHPLNRRRLALTAYKKISSAALTAAAHRGLVWVHYPIPHLPGIFDTDSWRVTWFGGDTVSGYVQNVGLVDETVGRLRRAMGSEWDRSAIILTSDHSWRQSRLYDGRHSTRVPMYVKLPRGADAGVVQTEVLARGLPHALLGLLRGSIKNRADVERAFVEGPQAPLSLAR